MNVVKFDHSKFSKEILTDLVGKKFFAVSIDNGVYEIHIPEDMMKSQVIYGCELVRYSVMKQSIDDYNEMENQDG